MRQEDGFSIATLIVLVMALSVGMAAVAPNYQIAAQRELEEELVFRGEEYVRAIQKYQRRFGVYPPTIEALLDSNGIGFLRRAYVDPITGDEFHLLTATPTGGIDGSILYPDSTSPLLQGSSRDSDSSGRGASGADGGSTGNSNRGQGNPFQQSAGFGFQSGFGGPGQEAGIGSEGGSDFEEGFGDFASFGSGGFGGGSGQGAVSPGSGTGSGSGSERPLDLGQQSGTQFGSFSGLPQSGSDSGFGRGGGGNETAQSGFGPPDGNPGQTNERGESDPGSASGARTAPAGLSGIVGVRPISDAPSLKVYNGRGIYMEWEFIALPRTLGESAAAGAASGDAGDSFQPPSFDQNQSMPSVGSAPSPFQSEP